MIDSQTVFVVMRHYHIACVSCKDFFSAVWQVTCLNVRIGDEINVLMAFCGINLKKLLESLRTFLSQLISILIFADLRLNYKNQAEQFVYRIF